MLVRMPLCLLIFLLSFIAFDTKAQKSAISNYGISVISDLNDYKELVARDSSKAIVELKAVIPNIKLDIRYATADNFMKKPMYKTSAAFLSLPAVLALKEVQQELKKWGYGLKIYDGYRPYSITVAFY